MGSEGKTPTPNKQTKKSMTAHQLLDKLHFTPPSHTWVRRDPRGAEYGVWHARPAFGKNNVFMSVTYLPSTTDLAMFTINFETSADFERWVSHAF
jgi:hypothetical protein